MATINDIFSALIQHNPSALHDVVKSYQLAKDAHEGIVRESGEPYITHPINVCMNLLDMEIYDKDCLCAALLHDVVEDTNITLEDISEKINPEVAELVDGVTKMRRMNFSTKEEQMLANTRKIINGLNKDVRIIMIKLADRLHNMSTLEYKQENKQKENALETMELFVPLALSVGAYQIKSKLEDLSLMYLEPDAYQRIIEKRDMLAVKEKEYLEEMKAKLEQILKEKDIPSDIIVRTMNACNIYKRIIKGYEMENIYDLFYLKVLVDEVEDCYRALQCVHRNTPPINGRFKDYIFNPRTNYYQSLHTTVSDMNGKLIKTKIRTHDMDKVSAFGISAYWNLKEDKDEFEIPLHKTLKQTQEEIRSKLQFAKKLQELDGSFSENSEFFKEIKQELLTEHVYVYTHSGENIELPLGSTALDFACQVSPELLDTMTGVLVNGIQCPVHTVLKNNDRVQVLTNGLVNREDWENSAYTNTAKQKIKMLNEKSSE